MASIVRSGEILERKVTQKLLVANYQIDITARRVFLAGEEIKIRPKSFELLQLLLNSPNQVISKADMLTTIWDDVTVDEQVIFQSIKELRKAFAELDAIKTYPRKGYSWVIPVTPVNESVEDKDESATVITPPELLEYLATTQQNNKPFWLLGLAAFAVTLLLLFFLFLAKQSPEVKKNLPVSGSVLVLPVKDNIKDRDHKWVSIGAMDQIIQQIPPAKTYAVMQIEDVLEVMSRAKMPLRDYRVEQVEKVFAVSGADLIVESELNGTPGDYQLVYTLRRRQSIDRGVFIASDAYEVFDLLAKRVLTVLGTQRATLSSLHNKLADQLLAQAIDRKNIEDYPGTEKFLTSLLAIEPQNLTAKRLLAQVLAYMKKTEQINALVDTTVVQQETGMLVQKDEIHNQREYGRLKFWQGLNELQIGHTDNAQQIFDQAYVMAKNAQDWLYLAHLSELQGHLHRVKKEYSLAEQAYYLAIEQYQWIKCPYGEVSSLLYLAETDFLREDVISAQRKAAQSLAIAEKRELLSLKKKADLANEKYNALLSQ